MKSQPPAPGPLPESFPHATNWTRRRFLQAAGLAALASPFWTPRALGQGAVSPNSKLQHACIGVGGMGWGDLHNFLSHPRAQIVAMCDVDANTLARAAKEVPKARLYSDWRELLEKESGNLDSVNVTVPDHMHFSIAYSAIQRGKHVYCQKPLCHDVAEVRALTEAAVARRVVTQLGTQVAASPHDRTAVIWMKEGRIGKIKHAYLCSNRPGAVQDYRLLGPRPSEGQPPPKELNWPLWLGSAPPRPYAPGIYHPTKWRAWQDFGTGWSGDIGCHIFDPVWKGLGLKPATSVVANVERSWEESPARRADTWPQANHITWTFPGNDKIQDPELVLEWFDGEFYPPEEVRRLYSAKLEDYPPESSMLIGTEGALLTPHNYPPQLLPEEKFKDVKRPDLPPHNHYHLFVDACLGGAMTESHFAQTGPMTEAIVLGTVAIREPGKKLKWNSKKMKVTNERSANRLLKRAYAPGWKLAGF